MDFSWLKEKIYEWIEAMGPYDEDSLRVAVLNMHNTVEAAAFDYAGNNNIEYEAVC